MDSFDSSSEEDISDEVSIDYQTHISHIKGTRFCIGTMETRETSQLTDNDIRLIVVVMGDERRDISTNGKIDRCFRRIEGRDEHIRQIVYDLIDLPGSNILPIVHDAYKEVSEFLAKHEKGNILFHCAAGISRSPALVIGLLMKDGMRYNDAYELILRTRKVINPDPGFAYQLASLDNTLRKESIDI